MAMLMQLSCVEIARTYDVQWHDVDRNVCLIQTEHFQMLKSFEIDADVDKHASLTAEQQHPAHLRSAP